MSDKKYCNMANALQELNEPARSAVLLALPIEEFNGLNKYLDAERKFLLADIRKGVIDRKLTFNQ